MAGNDMKNPLLAIDSRRIAAIALRKKSAQAGHIDQRPPPQPAESDILAAGVPPFRGPVFLSSSCGFTMRPARALIDLSALRHNYRLAKSLSGCRALAVVKANAYGHGALECAAALDAEVDGFAVSAIEEALELRAAGHRQPIVLLEGWFEASELELICQHDL